jgi:hypothetical protein
LSRTLANFAASSQICAAEYGFRLLKSPLTTLFAKNQVEGRTSESPTHRTLAGECNRLVAMLAPAEHDRGTTLAQNEKPEIHELTAGYFIRKEKSAQIII